MRERQKRENVAGGGGARKSRDRERARGGRNEIHIFILFVHRASAMSPATSVARSFSAFPYSPLAPRLPASRPSDSIIAPPLQTPLVAVLSCLSVVLSSSVSRRAHRIDICLVARHFISITHFHPKVLRANHLCNGVNRLTGSLSVARSTSAPSTIPAAIHRYDGARSSCDGRRCSFPRLLRPFDHSQREEERKRRFPSDKETRSTKHVRTAHPPVRQTASWF